MMLPFDGFLSWNCRNIPLLIGVPLRCSILFELTGYYEEYEANFPTETKLDIESAFEKIKIDYESKFDKKYNSSLQVYKIYQVGTIDDWMNENCFVMYRFKGY